MEQQHTEYKGRGICQIQEVLEVKSVGKQQGLSPCASAVVCAWGNCGATLPFPFCGEGGCC